MITVTEWHERYEVSAKNFPALAGEQLRASPLQYIRLKVHGHAQGVGWRRLKIAAGDRLAEVFGIFCKLLEIAGNQKRGLRGAILNEKGQPASIEDISFILDIPKKQIINALSILTCDEIGWLLDSERKKEPKKETTQLNSTQLNSSVLEIPVNTGIPVRSDGRFNQFWKSYPNKKSKIDARRTWDKIKPSEELFSTIIKAVANQTLSQDWQKEKGKYIPHPATWLNRGQWDDEPTVIKSKADIAYDNLKIKYAAEDAADKAKVTA